MLQWNSFVLVTELLHVAEITSGPAPQTFFLSSLVTETQFYWAASVPAQRLHFPGIFAARLGHVTKFWPRRSKQMSYLKGKCNFPPSLESFLLPGMQIRLLRSLHLYRHLR